MPAASRASHVVVAARAAVEPPCATQQVVADEARRDTELAWCQVLQQAPLAGAAVLYAATCVALTSGAGITLAAWGATVLALLVSAGALVWRRRCTVRARRACLVLVVALLFVLAAAAWLPPDLPTADSALARTVAVAAAAAAAALAFAPLPAVPWVAALLPWVYLLPGTGDAPLAGVGVAGLLLAVVAVGARHAWQRQCARQLQAERSLRAAEAARAAAEAADQDKTRFLSAASHDLRQPVHALGLFAATLDKRLRRSREEALVRNVVRSIEGLDRSLNAVLDISRLDAGGVEPNFQHFPLRDLFRRLHMQFAGQAELAGLGLRFSPGGKWLTSDPVWLERILANLIQNALKYTVRGGVAVVARTTATHFHVEVWDTGVGIAGAELPRIFDEYYQVRGHGGLRPQGIGMGLAIVRRLVRLLGHELTVASQPGRGTMFRLAIRQHGVPAVQDLVAPADTQPMAPGRARTVLVVEDDAAVRQGLALLLEEAGYVALPAASLAQARQLLRVLELPPDLLLTDLHLGPGGDGLAVIAELRRACAFELPAIVITGDIAPAQQAQLQSLPVLFKPVDPRRLLQQVQRLVA